MFVVTFSIFLSCFLPFSVCIVRGYVKKFGWLGTDVYLDKSKNILLTRNSWDLYASVMFFQAWWLLIFAWVRCGVEQLIQYWSQLKEMAINWALSESFSTHRLSFSCWIRTLKRLKNFSVKAGLIITRTMRTFFGKVAIFWSQTHSDCQLMCCIATLLGNVEELDSNNCKELQLHSASNSSNLIHTLKKCLKELKKVFIGWSDQEWNRRSTSLGGVLGTIPIKSTSIDIFSASILNFDSGGFKITSISWSVFNDPFIKFILLETFVLSILQPCIKLQKKQFSGSCSISVFT